MITASEQARSEKIIRFLVAISALQRQAYARLNPPQGTTYNTEEQCVLLATFINGMAFGRRRPEYALRLANIFERAFAPLNDVSPEQYEVQCMTAVDILTEIMED